MRKGKRSKPHWEMSTRELKRATKEFERPFVADLSEPLTPAMRGRWRKAKRKLGSPRPGTRAKLVAITLERGLLRKVDAFAKRKGMSRSAAVTAGLEVLLSTEE